MYKVECLRCDFSTDADTLRAVLDLEREHRFESGDRHLLKWEEELESV